MNNPVLTATPVSLIVFSPTSVFAEMTNASPSSSQFPPPAFVGLSGPSRALSVSNASSDAQPCGQMNFSLRGGEGDFDTSDE